MNGLSDHLVKTEWRPDAVNLSLSLPTAWAYDAASLRPAAFRANWGQQARQLPVAIKTKKATYLSTTNAPAREKEINRQLS